MPSELRRKTAREGIGEVVIVAVHKYVCDNDWTFRSWADPLAKIDCPDLLSVLHCEFKGASSRSRGECALLYVRSVLNDARGYVKGWMLGPDHCDGLYSCIEEPFPLELVRGC